MTQNSQKSSENNFKAAPEVQERYMPLGSNLNQAILLTRPPSQIEMYLKLLSGYH
jgi:hypothetical protein